MQAFIFFIFLHFSPGVSRFLPLPQKNKYLFNRFYIALVFPFLAHADVLALMEPFILLNGEKDILHTPTELQLGLLQEIDPRRVPV